MVITKLKLFAHHNRLKLEKSCLVPVMKVLLGALHHILGQHRDAILNYSAGCLVQQRRVMECVVQELKTFQEMHAEQLSQPPSPQRRQQPSQLNTSSSQQQASNAEFRFLLWVYDLSPVLGLQVYRLLTELLYRKLQAQLHVEILAADKSLTLTSFRSFPGSQQSNDKRQHSNNTSRARFVVPRLHSLSIGSRFCHHCNNFTEICF